MSSNNFALPEGPAVENEIPLGRTFAVIALVALVGGAALTYSMGWDGGLGLGLRGTLHN